MIQQKNLKGSIYRGISWSSLSTATTQVLNIVIFVILAKYYLDPKDFGLVAIIVVLTGFGSIFTEFGLGAALIQKKDIDDSHMSSIFWLSLVLGISIYIIFLLLRPSISEFYERPILYEMTTLLSLTLVVAASTSVQMSLLKKALRFKTIAIITISANMLSGSISILMASLDFGSWSLVAKAIVFQVILSLLTWTTCSWRPKYIFKIAAIKEVFSFSISYFSTTVFTNIVIKADELLIGKIAGENSLGLYSNAFRLVLMPITLIKNQIIGVLFPALSTIQDDHERIKNIVLKLSGILALLGFPVLFFLAVSSKDLILLLLNENWLEMELMVVILSFIAMFEISIFPGVIFLSQGHAGKYFRLIVYTKSLSVILFTIGIFINGVTGLLIGMLIASIINFVPYIYFSGQLIGMRVIEQLNVNILPFTIALIGAFVVKVSEHLIASMLFSPWVVVVTKFILYFTVIFILYIITTPYPSERILRNIFNQR